MRLARVVPLVLLPLLPACASSGGGVAAGGPAVRTGDRPTTATAEAVYYPMEGPAKLPFSSAVRVGRVLYLSGQIGTDSTGRLVAGGIGPETRQALENVRRVVERAGSSMSRVVKCTAMLADMREWAAMNEVYVTFFPDHLPARSAFGAAGLALGARVEIECLAVLP